MLPENKTKLASLALAGALAVGFTGAASAQDWSQTTYRETHHAMHYRYSTPQRYDYGYHREGYYRDGYDDGYRDGPVGAAGAIVGSALGAADTAAAVATVFLMATAIMAPARITPPPPITMAIAQTTATIGGGRTTTSIRTATPNIKTEIGRFDDDLSPARPGRVTPIYSRPRCGQDRAACGRRVCASRQRRNLRPFCKTR